VIQQAVFVAHAEDQREPAFGSSAEVREQHRTKRRDAGARGHKYGVGNRTAENERAVRALEIDFVAGLHGEETGREIAVRNEIRAERDAFARRRDDRVGAGDFFVIDCCGEGQELAGDESGFPVGRVEFEVARVWGDFADSIRRAFIVYGPPGRGRRECR